MVTATSDAGRFLESVRGEDGAYRIDRWPPVRARPWRRRPGRAVARLRLKQRRTLGFLDPLEDALFLTAGLRRLGFPASFHLGREIVPASPVAGYLAWVELDGQVLSTSLPVHETFLEVHRSESR
jgi:hypothetical protein